LNDLNKLLWDKALQKLLGGIRLTGLPAKCF